MRRTRKGQSLIEFVLATLIVVPVMMLFIDSFLIVYAIQLNDLTCFEAARLASNGEPRLSLVRASQLVNDRCARGHSPFSLELVSAGTSITKSQIDAMKPYG